MHHTWTNEFLEPKRQVGDPMADEVIRLLVEEKGPQEARRVFDHLITNIDLPLEGFSPILTSYLEATNQLPVDSDWKQIEIANELFIDHGPKFLLFLYYKSLPLLYLNAKGAVVLEKTSRLTNQSADLRIFARRVAETGQFLLDVMTPGNLAPGAKGIRAIQKVRLIHAAVRYFIPPQHWDTAQLGVPINQEDLAQTLMTFSISPVDTLAQFKVNETDDRLQAYVNTWNYIGELMGIHTDLLPIDVAQARDLLQTILNRQAISSPAGILLAKALIDFAKTNLPADFERAPELLMTYMIGRDQAVKLGIQTEMGCLGTLIPEVFKAYFNWSEKLEDKLEGPLNVFVQHLAKRTTEAMVNYFDTYKGRNFTIPSTLQKAWSIEKQL